MTMTRVAVAANLTAIISLMANWNLATSYTPLFGKTSHQLLAVCRLRSRQPILSFSTASCTSLRSTTSSSVDNVDQTQQSEPPFWQARQNCWRPDVRDVESISWGLPAKKKGTGSRGIPHRLNQEERLTFDQARRQGFLQVTGSAWRSQRRDAPLLNSYRSLMDARGRPMIVLHKMNPNSSIVGSDCDRLVLDLSPLRLPLEFERMERKLEERVMVEFNVRSQRINLDQDDFDEISTESNADDENHDDGWETRPIYQLPPHSLSWEVSRQQGKQIGKYLGNLFDNVEERATTSKKPQGVKPGKGRRHGGYGIG
ncbi:hypothetical protein ACHAXH_008766 [Discostella pseudostelligera]